MRRALRTRRAALVLIALVMAAAFPITLPSSHEYEPSAEVVMMNARASSDAEVVVVMPSGSVAGGTTSSAATVTQSGNNVTQTVAMMLVGSLLISIGSVVRRVV